MEGNMDPSMDILDEVVEMFRPALRETLERIRDDYLAHDIDAGWFPEMWKDGPLIEMEEEGIIVRIGDSWELTNEGEERVQRARERSA
jgi:hypothetical protein